jgi:transcriptional regulator with XRE-family HTH domain
MQGPFLDRLRQEFRRRRETNSRYSLRAFALFLNVDHSTLSQILRGGRRVPLARMRLWARRLGLGPEEAAAYIASEHLRDASSVERESQVRHWSAEAMAIIEDGVHWDILRLSRTPEFRADSQWIAQRIAGTVDQVNIAFTRLLRLRLIETNATGNWLDHTKSSVTTEHEFRQMALAGVRERAAEL